MQTSDSFYSYIDLGEYTVGFCDTLIFDNEVRFDFLPDTSVSYEQYDYKGPTPLFVQIWHPIIDVPYTPPLTYGDLRHRNLRPDLESVYEPLQQKEDTFFVKYNLSLEITKYDSIDYGADYFEVLDDLSEYKTKSYYQKLKEAKDFPIIIYHHGAQAASDDNFILSEYFASRGYIVISANFHLPFESRTYGYEGVKFDDTKLPRRLMEFAQTLVSENSKVYYFGHSAGAQVGFKFLHEVDRLDGFVSLETTMEETKLRWLAKLYLLSKFGWPDLAKEINKHKDEYDFPIFMIANTRADKSFALFKGITSPLMVHASERKWFSHDAYASSFHMRYLYRHKWAQPDIHITELQLELYVKLLKLIESFLEQSQTGKFNPPETLAENYHIIKMSN